MTVTSVSTVPEAVASYYQSNGVAIGTLIDSLPAAPDYKEVLSSLQIPNIAGNVGNSTFSSNVVAMMDWKLKIATAGSYTFTLNGGNPTRMFVNGNRVTGPISLQPGTYPMQARFALSSASSLPATVLFSFSGGSVGPVNSANITHDESALKPFINDMSSSGSP